MQFCWAELCSVSLHQRSKTAQWGDLQARQHLLPMFGDSAGTYTLSLLPVWIHFVSCWCLFFLRIFWQYLFMKGRIENIFTDALYNQFAVEVTEMLRLWKSKPLRSGMIPGILFMLNYLFPFRNSLSVKQPLLVMTWSRIPMLYSYFIKAVFIISKAHLLSSILSNIDNQRIKFIAHPLDIIVLLFQCISL